MRRRQIQGSIAAPVAATEVRVGMSEPEVEHRFVVDPLQAQAFFACVSPFVAAEEYDRDRPVCYLRTTYFDTANRHFFHSSGRLGRARVRVRQYAGAAAPDAPAVIGERCAFEIKMSIFESRRIARLIDTPEGIEEVLQGGWRDDADLGDVRALRRAARGVAGGKLAPVVTTYFRRTSQGAPGIRITFDDQIAFAQPAPIGRPGTLAEPDGVFSRAPHGVLEVKLSAPPPTWMSDAMRILRRTGSESKFHDAMRIAQRLDVLAAAARSPTQPRRLLARGLFPFEQEPTYA